MKKAMIATALALLAFAGCKLEDKKDFTVSVPALAQALDLEAKIRKELATCSHVEASSLKFTSTHICVHVKSKSDTVKKSVFDALARAGCDGIEMQSLQVNDTETKGVCMLRAGYKTISGVLSGCSGVESYDFDTPNARVSVKYDSMKTAEKNIEMAIAEAGYTANGVTPESVGAKPKEKK